jgi:hypothetical protein
MRIAELAIIYVDVLIDDEVDFPLRLLAKPNSEGVRRKSKRERAILKGVVSKDQVHIHIEYPSCRALSDMVKRMKARTSRRLQEEYPALGKRY